MYADVDVCVDVYVCGGVMLCVLDGCHVVCMYVVLCVV